MDNKKAHIIYRLERSKEALEEATILYNNKKWNATINRIYYSCFYAVVALLLQHNIKTTTHDGVRNQFGFHFIKTKKIEKEYGRFFSLLFDYRLKGDYGDMFDFTEEQVSPLIKKVPEFLAEIKKHIQI
ncbi:Uncharacterized protein, contains HEPN domain, UPF0332 family [Tangfeifania diversioriginum]|uniref:Uncharacterized protein, contains HEPN domain, UPF0332 family n=1 Tax=Tangfeifania diversioriginum TaxID=1168035 RepID=A0A1M6JUG9_9BACT|nr:HEPN domain-containing protein [Tangfeifania diversioriginum]SHJ50262.1 Uncharacterized protein, contains HEPN domain, UPF0332 family [Tangfeifania diversioriginum]